MHAWTYDEHIQHNNLNMASLATSVLARELAAGLSAVRAACRLSRAVQSHLSTKDKLVKLDASPVRHATTHTCDWTTHPLTHCSTNQVTVADFGVQALVTLSLQRTLGATNFRLVAEEEPDALAKDKELLAKVQCFHNCW